MVWSWALGQSLKSWSLLFVPSACLWYIRGPPIASQLAGLAPSWHRKSVQKMASSLSRVGIDDDRVAAVGVVTLVRCGCFASLFPFR